MPVDTKDWMATAVVGTGYDTPSNYCRIPFALISSQLDGYRGPRRPSVVNDCTHTRTHVQALGVNVKSGHDVVAGVIPLTVGARPDTRASAFNGYINPTVPEATLRQLQATMAGDIAPLVNVPNMVLEMPSTLTLWNDLKDPVMELLSLSRRGTKGRLKSGSCALLAQQFGLFPLIGDLATLLTSTRSIHSEVSAIKRRSDRWTGTSKTVSVNPGYTPLLTNSGAFGTLSISKAVASGVAKVSYQHRKIKDIVPVSSLASEVGRKLYGFDNPAGVLWEATPYSFVADWFFPVGSYLNALNMSAFADSMQYRNVCTCYKVTASCEINLQYGSNYNPCSSHVVRQTLFKRRSGFPSSSMVVGDFGVPGLRQLTLGAALVLQKS